MPDTPPASDAADPGPWVTLARFAREFEAQLFSNRLAAEAIDYQILNTNTRNTLALYGSMVNIDVQVLARDLERARAVSIDPIYSESAERLVPAEPDDPVVATQGIDANGSPVHLLAAGVFPSVHALRAAIGTLDASGIESFAPRLIERPAGQDESSAAFVLRVCETDVYRAQLLIQPTREGPNDVELCCPRCGGWNIFEMNHEIKNMVLSLVGQARPPECECLQCHFVSARSAFEAAEFEAKDS